MTEELETTPAYIDNVPLYEVPHAATPYTSKFKQETKTHSSNKNDDVDWGDNASLSLETDDTDY